MTRQDIVTDQNLKNGMGSLLEYVSEAFRLNAAKGPDAARAYLHEVAEDIITDKGRPAPENTGPVTPTNG